MYILAVAWEDGAWHHVKSYTSERAHRPSTVRLWHQIRTEEVEEWTQAYHATNPDEKKFGAEVVVVMKDGTRISERLDNPNAHYLGKRPFSRPDYVRKLQVLSEGVADPGEIARFVGLVERLPQLSPAEVRQLNPVAISGKIEDAHSERVGLF
jgi:2-methylcitrate dehydratase